VSFEEDPTPSFGPSSSPLHRSSLLTLADDVLDFDYLLEMEQRAPAAILHPESWAARATETWEAMQKELDMSTKKAANEHAGIVSSLTDLERVGSTCGTQPVASHLKSSPVTTPPVPNQAGLNGVVPFALLSIEERAVRMLENPLLGRSVPQF
jgi:hypothetical protein